MGAPRPVERVRLTPRSAVTAVALFGVALAIIRLLSAAQRVLGWLLVAAAIAGLLHPVVARLSRRIPRGLAVAMVAVLGVAGVATATYRVVDDIADQTARLRRAAPEAARRIENDGGRFAELAREVELADRAQRFVDEVPERLRGGTPAEALRAAATRGVAYLTTGVLTLFLLIHGPALAAAAAQQVHDPRQRARLERVAGSAFTRGFGYARGTLATAVAAGLVAFGLASAADVPGAAPLGLWVALWDVVPYLGALVGAVPVVVLGGVGNPGRGFALAGAFLVYELVETFVVQRRLERRTVRVGPFLSAAAGFAGLELYGLGGALMALLVLSVAMAALDELAPGDPAPPPAPGAPAGAQPP